MQISTTTTHRAQLNRAQLEKIILDALAEQIPQLKGHTGLAAVRFHGDLIEDDKGGYLNVTEARVEFSYTLPAAPMDTSTEPPKPAPAPAPAKKPARGKADPTKTQLVAGTQNVTIGIRAAADATGWLVKYQLRYRKPHTETDWIGPYEMRDEAIRSGVRAALHVINTASEPEDGPTRRRQQSALQTLNALAKRYAAAE
jgi:hypothetical protein